MKKPGLGQLYGFEHCDKLGNNEEACKLNEKKKTKEIPTVLVKQKQLEDHIRHLH